MATENTMRIPEYLLPRIERALREAQEDDARHAARAGLEFPASPEIERLATEETYECPVCLDSIPPEGMVGPFAAVLSPCHRAPIFVSRFITIRVTSKRPTVGDFELVACAEPMPATHDGKPSPNLIRMVPGATISDVERSDHQTGDATRCDHCGFDRRRNETFLVREAGGRLLQVGRNCLAAFLGGASYEMIIRRLMWPTAVTGILQEGGGGGREIYRPALEQVMFLTACILRRDGWVTRKDAEIRNTESSASRVQFLCEPCPTHPAARDAWLSEIKRLEPQEGDVSRAREAITWVREEMVPVSDFEHSIRTVGNLAHVERYGLVCAILPAYYKARGLEITGRARAAKAPTEYLGNPKAKATKTGWTGSKETVIGVVETCRAVETQFGVSTVIVVRSLDGRHVVQWWKSGEVGSTVGVGDTVEISGTVKGHEEGRYQQEGDKVTQMTRCKIKPHRPGAPPAPRSVSEDDQGDLAF